MNETQKASLQQIVALAQGLLQVDATDAGIGLYGGFHPPGGGNPPPPPPGPAPGPTPPGPTPPEGGNGNGFYCYSCGRWNAT